MKRIYLDTNKWVNLAAARASIKAGERYEDVLTVAEAAVATGAASFPLSMVHYVEVANRRDWRSRSELAETMARLSRLHSLAPPQALIPAEIDRALQAVFGRPSSCRPLRPFGVGAAHVFANDAINKAIPADLPLPPEARWLLEQQIAPVREWFLLAGVPPELEEQVEGFDPAAHRRWASEYAAEQEKLRGRRKAAGWSKGAKADDLFAADVFEENFEYLRDALAGAGIPAEAVYALGKDGMNAMLRQIPTMHATAELRRQRHVASQKPLDANDIADLVALPGAIAYCDVIVTEVQWTDAARRRKLGHQHGTVVLHDLTELVAQLL